MHPVLLHLGPLEIRSYGVMLAAAFASAAYFAMWRAEKFGVPKEALGNLLTWVVVSGVLGARFFYAAFHWDEFRGHAWDVVNPFQGGRIGIAGLTWYGGLILATGAGILYLRARKLPLWRTMDLIAPSVGLGIFLGRIGCFLNGCCFGRPSELPWAVVFPPESPAGSVFPGVSIHPTQLYMSLYGLIIFGTLLWAERFRRWDGFTFWLLVVLYASARFLVDFVRYYEESMQVHLGGMALSVNQVLSVGLFLVGLGMQVYLGRRR